jgi:hypothetical protein
MKFLLALSLIGNVVMAHLLTTQEKRPEVIERVVIETHQEKVPAVNPPESAKESAPAPKEKKETKSPLDVTFDAQEYVEATDSMEAARTQFFTEKLGLPEEKVARHRKLRQEFFEATTSFWKKNAGAHELPLSERRRLLDLEEEYLKNLERLYGKKNWKEYQRFRERYNERGFRRQEEENQPFIYMPY